ncbi:TonB-dependent receptor [Pseudobacteriovorax antillogorgiicola]|uniref:TonB-dependent receptor n=1 Tax=Pseudobacteriovorax antillogorgiicola TaxID=1513793 RepID=UPI0013562E95|nr:TonB-dependent receptor [Pseudobacteriovorax antillogorgiicola]
MRSAKMLARLVVLMAIASRPALGGEIDVDDLLALPLEEVLNLRITPRKVEESVQNSSLSVTAIGPHQLDLFQLDDIQDLGPHIPGLVLGLSGYDQRPSMRGARSRQINHNDVSTPIYIDGIYRPRHAQASLPFFDLAQIEVLRGPQGTLYGRNSFGGAINVFSHPAEKISEVKTSIRMGSYQRQRYTLIVNQALSETVQVRASLLSDQHTPYVENNYNSSAGYKDKDSLYGRAKLAWQLNSKLDFELQVSQWNEASNGNGAYGYRLIGTPLNPSTGLSNGSFPVAPRIGTDTSCSGTCGRFGAGADDAATPVPEDVFTVSNNLVPRQEITEQAFLLKSQYQTGDLQVRLLLGQVEFDDRRRADSDFSPYESFEEGYRLISSSQSAELQIILKSWNGLSLVIGSYLFQEDLDYTFIFKNLYPQVDNRADTNQTPLNEYPSWLDTNRVETSSQAYFTHIKQALTEKLHLILGARHTEDSRRWSARGINPNDLTKLDFDIPLFDGRSKTFSNFSYKGGLDITISPNLLFYGFYSTGFLAGNTNLRFSAPTSYDSQKAKSIELGSKFLSSRRNLRLNLSLYENQFEDLLATGIDDLDGVAFTVEKNAGSIKAQGLEVELDYHLTPRLSLGFRGEWARTTYQDFIVGNGFEEGGETINGQDNLLRLDGLQVAFSPSRTATILATGHFDAPWGGKLSPAVLLYLSSEYRVTDEDYLFAKQAAYHTTEVNGRWTSLNHRFSISVFVKNLGNAEVLNYGNRFGGNVAGTGYQDPQTWGVELSAKY